MTDERDTGGRDGAADDTGTVDIEKPPADVQEQRQTADRAEPPGNPVSDDIEVPEADAFEQAQAVPADEDDTPR
jgi:hypothetical protein